MFWKHLEEYGISRNYVLRIPAMFLTDDCVSQESDFSSIVFHLKHTTFNFIYSYGNDTRIWDTFQLAQHSSNFRLDSNSKTMCAYLFLWDRGRLRIGSNKPCGIHSFKSVMFIAQQKISNIDPVVMKTFSKEKKSNPSHNCMPNESQPKSMNSSFKLRKMYLCRKKPMALTCYI